MRNQKVQNTFFATLLIVSLVLVALLLKPYFSVIIIAGALAIVFAPIHKKILKATKNKQSLSAIITLFLVFLIIITPLFLIGFQVYQEAFGIYYGLSENNFNQVDKIIIWGEKTIQRISPNFSFNITAQKIVSPVLSFTVKHLGDIFSGAARGILFLTLSLISLFYFFKDGSKLKKYLIELSPLKDKDDQSIFTALKNTINATVRGSLVMAIVQGFLAGLGFLIFGVPNATLWGSVGVIASFIPSVGMAIIIVPGIIYLLTTGKLFFALGLLLWGLTVIGLSDNFLIPKLIKKGMAVHPLLILFSILGGISLFGLMGILIGPMIVSLFFALIKIYPEIL